MEKWREIRTIDLVGGRVDDFLVAQCMGSCAGPDAPDTRHDLF
jgi:hypothetical protein